MKRVLFGTLLLILTMVLQAQNTSVFTAEVDTTLVPTMTLQLDSVDNWGVWSDFSTLTPECANGYLVAVLLEGTYKDRTCTPGCVLLNGVPYNSADIVPVSSTNTGTFKVFFNKQPKPDSLVITTTCEVTVEKVSVAFQSFE